MFSIYENWPKIANDSFKSKLEKLDFHNIDHIVFLGMGGSGTISDILASILSKSNIHTNIVKGYTFPKTVTSDTLVIATSVSGNTQETLTVLNDIKKITSKIVCFSSGGKIKNFSQKHNFQYRQIPMFHSPRASLTSFLYSILNILSPILLINDNQVLESIQSLNSIQKNFLSSFEESLEYNIAKSLDKIPTIYYPFGLQAAAIRFKNSLHENSKLPAIIEDVIEASHNNIASWSNNPNTFPILIQGTDDHPKTKERWSILKEFFKNNDIQFKEIYSPNGYILTKLISLIYSFDIISIFRAMLLEIDPSPISPIQYVKSKLSYDDF